jgi:hypothetical protein
MSVQLRTVVAGASALNGRNTLINEGVSETTWAGATVY